MTRGGATARRATRGRPSASDAGTSRAASASSEEGSASSAPQREARRDEQHAVARAVTGCAPPARHPGRRRRGARGLRRARRPSARRPGCDSPDGEPRRARRAGRRAPTAVWRAHPGADLERARRPRESPARRRARPSSRSTRRSAASWHRVTSSPMLEQVPASRSRFTPRWMWTRRPIARPERAQRHALEHRALQQPPRDDADDLLDHPVAQVEAPHDRRASGGSGRSGAAWRARRGRIDDGAHRTRGREPKQRQRAAGRARRPAPRREGSSEEEPRVDQRREPRTVHGEPRAWRRRRGTGAGPGGRRGARGAAAQRRAAAAARPLREAGDACAPRRRRAPSARRSSVGSQPRDQPRRRAASRRRGRGRSRSSPETPSSPAPRAKVVGDQRPPARRAEPRPRARRRLRPRELGQGPAVELAPDVVGRARTRAKRAGTMSPAAGGGGRRRDPRGRRRRRGVCRRRRRPRAARAGPVPCTRHAASRTPATSPRAAPRSASSSMR